MKSSALKTDNFESDITQTQQNFKPDKSFLKITKIKTTHQEGMFSWKA